MGWEFESVLRICNRNRLRNAFGLEPETELDWSLGNTDIGTPTALAESSYKLFYSVWVCFRVERFSSNFFVMMTVIVLFNLWHIRYAKWWCIHKMNGWMSFVPQWNIKFCHFLYFVVSFLLWCKCNLKRKYSSSSQTDRAFWVWFQFQMGW